MVSITVLAIVEFLLIGATILILTRIALNKSLPIGEKASFIYLMLTMLGWMCTIYSFNFHQMFTYDSFFGIARLSWMWPPMMLSALFHFYLVKFRIIKSLWVRGAILSSGIIFGLVSLLTNFTVTGINLGTTRILFGTGYTLSILYIIAIALAITRLTYAINKSLKPQDKIRLRFLTFGYLLTIGIASLTNIVVPLIFKTSRFSHLAIFAVIPTIFVSYYILVANRFYDLKIIKQSILKFFIFDLLIAIAYYLTFALASLAGKNVLSFDSFLYGQVLLVGLYIYYYRYLFEDRRTNLHEGFYRYTLARGSREDSLRIQYLLQVFRDNLQTKYNINSLYLTVILYERAKHYIVGKKVTQEPLYENRVFINNSSEHVLELIIYDKLDGFDLSIQDVENVEKDLNELLHLIFQSILYEESINFTDVLQQKINQATETLRVQKQELQEKYQFEKDMMGIMGHELRTPMTVAKGMTELVMNKIKANTLDNAYADEKLSKIYASIIKEADLIQTMLSTAHIDNKKVNLQISEVNLFDVVDYSVTAFHKDATDKGLYLNFAQSSQQIPLIVSDSGRVQEIINNLVSNAVKYTNKGGVTVEIELTKDFVIVHVTDTGIGIPKSELKNLGRKFYRIHQHLDEKKEVVRAGGTGLGLYVVKGLLNALGGELKVKSKEGVGSTFSAYFPLKTDYHDNVFITQKPVDEHDMFEKLGLKTNQ